MPAAPSATTPPNATPSVAPPSTPRAPAPRKPIALVVFLENVGHIHGVPLPRWANQVVDYVTEEYAKLLLRVYGAYRRYDRVILLEDEKATGPQLVAALRDASRTHQVDVLLLVHGQPHALVGYQGKVLVGPETFGPLLAAQRADPALLDLRMVYGVNCYGAGLAPTWLALGAKVTNGACGVNWLPEPSLSIFLRNWLGGQPFSQAVARSHRTALRWGVAIWRPSRDGRDHPFIAGSRQTIFGVHDLTIRS
ncbi:MAG: hypothetical protein IT329_09025 [Caldilineaceae bacterium]|nr:hypothetical protein [Caldilineaceae bacterium]